MDESAALSLLERHLVLEPVTLLVGTDVRDLPESVQMRLTHRVESLPLALIHAVLARAPETKEIISPLFADSFDATELAYELFRAEFRGALTIVAPKMPQPDLILQELRSICPHVTLALVCRTTH